MISPRSAGSTTAFFEPHKLKSRDSTSLQIRTHHIIHDDLKDAYQSILVDKGYLNTSEKGWQE